MSQVRGVLADRPRDCLACRLVGGLGLVGVGLYIGYHGSRRQGYAKPGMYLIASLAGGLGTARIFNLPPFDKSFSKQEEHKTVNASNR